MRELLREYFERIDGVDAVYLFGSRATGRPRRDSDVDIAVLFPAELDPAERLESRLRIAVELEKHIGHPVDVVDLELASPPVQHQVLKARAILIDRNEARRVGFEMASRRQYFDYQIDHRIFERAAAARLRGGKVHGGDPSGSRTLEAARRILGRLKGNQRD